MDVFQCVELLVGQLNGRIQIEGTRQGDNSVKREGKIILTSKKVERQEKKSHRDTVKNPEEVVGKTRNGRKEIKSE